VNRETCAPLGAGISRRDTLSRRNMACSVSAATEHEATRALGSATSHRHSIPRETISRIGLGSSAGRVERTRSLYRHCDEIQKSVAYGGGIETILSEGRKFQVPIVSAKPVPRSALGGDAGSAALGRHPRSSFSSQARTPHRSRRRSTAAGRLPNVEEPPPQRQTRSLIRAPRRDRDRGSPRSANPRSIRPISVNRCRGIWGRSRVVIKRAIASARRTSEPNPPTRCSMAIGRQRGMVIQTATAISCERQPCSRHDREQAKPLLEFGSTTRANARLLALARAGLLKRFFLGRKERPESTLWSLPEGCRPAISRTGDLQRRTMNRSSPISLSSISSS